MAKLKELIKYLDGEHKSQMALMSAKVKDYSGEEDCNANLKACEVMGLCNMETGVLLRMLDKMKRLITLSKAKTISVKTESKIDTLRDLRIYAGALMFELTNGQRAKRNPRSTNKSKKRSR